MEANRRLPGAIEPARPGRGSNTLMQPFRMKPVPSGITPDGMPSEWVSETTSPSASTQETWVVSFGSPAGAFRRGTLAFSPRRIAAAQDRAYVVRQQPVERWRHEARVADMGVLVPGGDLHRLRHHADVLGRVVAQRHQVELLQDAQHLRHHHAAAGRPVGGELVAAVADADRLLHLGLEAGQVGRGQQAAIAAPCRARSAVPAARGRSCPGRPAPGCAGCRPDRGCGSTCRCAG